MLKIANNNTFSLKLQWTLQHKIVKENVQDQLKCFTSMFYLISTWWFSTSTCDFLQENQHCSNFMTSNLYLCLFHNLGLRLLNVFQIQKCFKFNLKKQIGNRKCCVYQDVFENFKHLKIISLSLNYFMLNFTFSWISNAIIPFCLLS
jgi:hypothetical protein